MKEKMRFPPEIWMIIIEQLASESFIRKAIFLIKVLKLNMNIDKYIIKTLVESRYKNYTGDYKEYMNELWERTGIDDGVDPDFLLKKLNENTRLYRTIWSHVILKDLCNEYYIHNSIYDYCERYDVDDEINLNDFKYKYTFSIIKDTRETPLYIDLNGKRTINPKDLYNMYTNDDSLINE